MKFKRHDQFTSAAQIACSSIKAVYTDETQEYFVEMHRVPTAHEQFECRLMIKRADKQPIRAWRILQDIKNDIVGKDRVAAEFYPRESDVTDRGNLYHLWVYSRDWEPDVRVV